MKALKTLVERILKKPTTTTKKKQTPKPTQELPLEIQIEKYC